MKKFYGTLAIALVLGLAACSEESSEVKESAPATKKEDSASKPEPAAPATQTEVPAAESTPAPAKAETPAAPAGNQQAEEKAADTASKDEEACLKAVATETSNDVVTLSVDPSEANTIVMVGVGPNKAPWKCLAKDGVVAEVMSMTDEGAL